MKIKPKISVLFLLLLCLAFGVSKANTLVEVPMKFRGSMPAVDVMINGKGPFLFAIDTGGQGQARADTTLVEKLGLKRVGEVMAGDGSGTNSRTLDLVGVDSIKIGDLEFKDVQALTRNYNRSPAVPKIDGILGFNLFENHLLTLDFPGKRVLISKGALPKPNGKDILQIETPNGIAVVELRVGDNTIKAHIDTGNMVAPFVFPSDVMNELELIGEPRVVGQARTISNTVEIKQARLKNSIILGEFRFDRPFVSYPAPRSANIGSRLLKDFSITFDQKNKRVKLKQTGAAKKAHAVVTTKHKDYIGVYGSRTIFERDGSLFIQREGGPELKLKNVGKDKFVLQQLERAKIEFIRNEKSVVASLKVLNPRGEWETTTKVLN